MIILNKKLNILLIILYTILFFVSNADCTFSYPTQIIKNADGTKTFQYIVNGDVYDNDLNIDETVNYNEYVLNEIPYYDSEIKVLEPIDNNEEVIRKNIYNANLEILKQKYNLMSNYLSTLNGTITSEEKELLLKYLFEMTPINSEFEGSKIYFDVDYNDVSIDDMKKIYNALIKIYDTVKTTAMPLTYYEHLGYDKYIYGYNIDFIRANIKALKHALSRNKIYKIDKNKLKNVKHNSKLDNNYYYGDNGEKIREKYKVIKVSDLIDDTYYKVEIETVINIPINISDIIDEIRVNDTIVFNDEEYIIKKDPYKDGTNENWHNILEIEDKNGKIYYMYDYLFDGQFFGKYIINVYKNAIFEEGYEYFLNNYVGSERLEDDFADNIICKDNLFENMKNKDFYFNLIDFDEKGYVKGLFKIKEQYE